MKNNQKDASSQEENQNIFPQQKEVNTAGTGKVPDPGIAKELKTTDPKMSDASKEENGTEETIGIP